MWGYVTGQDFDHLEAMGPQITYLLLAGEEIRKLRKELRRSSRDPRDPRDTRDQGVRFPGHQRFRSCQNIPSCSSIISCAKVDGQNVCPVLRRRSSMMGSDGLSPMGWMTKQKIPKSSKIVQRLL